MTLSTPSKVTSPAERAPARNGAEAIVQLFAAQGVEPSDRQLQRKAFVAQRGDCLQQGPLILDAIEARYVQQLDG